MQFVSCSSAHPFNDKVTLLESLQRTQGAYRDAHNLKARITQSPRAIMAADTLILKQQGNREEMPLVVFTHGKDWK